MGIDVRAQVGPRQGLGDGTENIIRSGRTGEVATVDAHGRYYEAASRGNVFFVADQTGKTVPAGLSASPTTVTLNNPKGSGVNAAILYAYIDFIVAFAAGSAVWIAANSDPSAANTTGTVATSVNALIGSTRTATVKAFTTATLPAAPVAICQLAAGITGAITTTPSTTAYGRDFGGALVIAPGGALSFQASTASGASGGLGEWCWEEIPL